jgi:branched-chain amino acid transport system ATP-binding protein
MEALKVEGLSKHFGGVAAVDDVSFSVQPGEHVVIIGPNGAGKTTLFNLINGQLAPTRGRIHFFGRDVTAAAIHTRAHLGMARSFQIISLLTELTVLDNTLLALHGTKPHRFNVFRRIFSYPDIRERTREVLENLGLWTQREAQVKNLAYGEQRRLEVGLGLAVQPKLLLLDEPSAGLTKEEGAEIIEIIRNLGEDLTVLIVDHDLDLVFEVAQRIIVLHYGSKLADGSPEVIKSDRRVMEIYMGSESGLDAGA